MSGRICSKCGGDGLFPATGNQCKVCHAKRKATWYQENKQERNEKSTTYRAAHPEQRKKRTYPPGKSSEWNRRSYQKNKETYRPKRVAYMRTYRASLKEKSE